MAKLVAEHTYTDAELLALYREAAAKLATAQEYELLGEKVVRADLPRVWEMITRLEARVAGAPGPIITLARRGRP